MTILTKYKTGQSLGDISPKKSGFFIDTLPYV